MKCKKEREIERKTMTNKKLAGKLLIIITMILINCKIDLTIAAGLDLDEVSMTIAGNGSVIPISSNNTESYNVILNLTEIPQTKYCPAMSNGNSWTQTELIARLTDDCRYDKLEPPINNGVTDNDEDEPLDVYARFYIYVIKNLDSSDMQFMVQGLLQLRYQDSRLAFSSYSPNRKQPIMGEGRLRDLIWVPHVFLANEHSSSVLGTNEKDIVTTIYPDGTVLISARIQATLYCWMNFQKFPFDEQKCTTILESWIYNTSVLVLHWEDTNPVTFDSQLQLTEYYLIGSLYNESISISDSYTMSHGALVGNYSTLSFTVLLTREVGYYIVDYFLPSIMIVTISWVSFWLQADQTPARTTLGCTTLLSFITLSLSQENNLSKVSYITMSEVWFLVCTIFIFGSLVEFAFVNTIWRRNNNLELKKRTTKYIVKSTFVPNLKRHRRGYNRSNSTLSTCSLDKSNNGGQNNTVITIETPIIIGNGLSRENSSISLEECESSLGSGSTATLTDSSTEKEKTPQTFATMTPKEVSLWIDRKMRFVFPLAFIIFNALFWTLVYCL